MSKRQHEDEQDQEQNGPTLSEAGSGALNAETSLGGADTVPDTPDVNTPISDTVDVNEEGAEGDARDPQIGR